MENTKEQQKKRRILFYLSLCSNNKMILPYCSNNTNYYCLVATALKAMLYLLSNKDYKYIRLIKGSVFRVLKREELQNERTKRKQKRRKEKQKASMP